VPAVLPVATPVVDPIVATVGELLVHTPPLVASVSVVDVVPVPPHTALAPEIAAGREFTVVTAVVIHVEGAVYVMVAVPAATPVRVPDDEPTVAVLMLLLLHVPPGVASDSAPRLSPTQVNKLPEIGAGGARKVSGCATVNEVPPLVRQVALIR